MSETRVRIDWNITEDVSEQICSTENHFIDSNNTHHFLKTPTMLTQEKYSSSWKALPTFELSAR